MDVILNRCDFLNELAPMNGIVERKTTIPTLSHVLLRARAAAGESRLDISGTDLEVSLTSSCGGDDTEVAEEGALAVPAKKLLAIVKACSDAEMRLHTDDKGTLAIHCGRSRFKIRGLPAEDFPTLAALDSDPVVFPFATFRAMIGKVFYAISSEESRFQLSGALFQVREGYLRMVATDGHRLALIEADADGVEGDADMLIPRKTLQELQRFDSKEDLELRYSDNHLSFRLGRRELICRVLEGSFPDFERVIAKDNDKIVKVDRKLLAGAVSRVSLLTGDHSRIIRLRLAPDEMEFSASNPDLGDAEETISAGYPGSEPLMMGVNPDYLCHFLAATTSENVRLELKDKNSQCVLYPEGGEERRYACVIMPIRLG